MRVSDALRLGGIALWTAIALLQPRAHVVALVALAVVTYAWCGLQIRWHQGDGWATDRQLTIALADLALLLPAISLSGGADSDLRWLALLTPIRASFALTGREVWALGAAVAISCDVVVALTAHGVDEVVVYVMCTAAAAIAAVAAAQVRDQMAAELRRRGDAQRELLARTGDVEAAERRRLSHALHDDALQTLLAARQDLLEAEDGHSDALGAARCGIEGSIAAVRALVIDLDASALAGARLPDALGSLVDRVVQRSTMDLSARLDPGAWGAHDELVFTIAREAIELRASDCRAAWLDVALSRDGAQLAVVLASDAPMTPEEAALMAREQSRLSRVGGWIVLAPAGAAMRIELHVPLPPSLSNVA